MKCADLDTNSVRLVWPVYGTAYDIEGTAPSALWPSSGHGKRTSRAPQFSEITHEMFQRVVK